MPNRSSSTDRPTVARSRRTVIKLGTRVLTDDDGRLVQSRLLAVAEAVATLLDRGTDVLLVSSGAVGLGKDMLGLEYVPEELKERQACAAVGQSRLMSLWREGFAHLGHTCGQVLLTQSDFQDRPRYLNLRNTLNTLLRWGVIPVINENDAVSTEELAFLAGARRRVFGDNDKLSALVATDLDADLLVLLTDVAGVFERDPRRDPEAPLLACIDDPERLTAEAGDSGSEIGRGGMRSKVEAATIASRGGCDAVIASGKDLMALPKVLRGESEGTWFPARPGLAARRRWIAFAVAPRGILRLDPGAIDAVRHRGASLLAAGVHAVEGAFERGDVVELRAADDSLIGRGMVFCDARTARRWCAGDPPDGIRNHDALIHRRHLALES
ncbi:MAG: glutamate 5-kinase [Acidobacteriota bacterium]